MNTELINTKLKEIKKELGLPMKIFRPLVESYRKLHVDDITGRPTTLPKLFQATPSEVKLAVNEGYLKPSETKGWYTITGKGGKIVDKISELFGDWKQYDDSKYGWFDVANYLMTYTYK